MSKLVIHYATDKWVDCWHTDNYRKYVDLYAICGVQHERGSNLFTHHNMRTKPYTNVLVEYCDECTLLLFSKNKTWPSGE